MASVKLLDELNLKELKQELKWRRLKCYERNIETLKERLRQALVEEEEDPHTYLFELEPDVVELLSTLMEQRLADLQNVLKGDSQKDEETREETSSSTNDFTVDVPDVSASINQIEQDNVVSYPKPVAGDIQDICRSASADERNSNLDGCTQMFGKNVICRAPQGECQLQVTHRHGLYPTDVCPAPAHTRVRSPVGVVKNATKPDAAVGGLLQAEKHRHGVNSTVDWSADETRRPDSGQRGELEPAAEDEGPSQVEWCQLAPLVCPPEKAEDEVCHSFPSCGPEAHSQSPSFESPLKKTVRPTILVTTSPASYPSPCVKWLPSVVKRRRKQRLLRSTWMAVRPRSQCKQVKVNWSRRRKRHLQTTIQKAPTRWLYKPTVAPTDKPPPASIQLNAHVVG